MEVTDDANALSLEEEGHVLQTDTLSKKFGRFLRSSHTASSPPYSSTDYDYPRVPITTRLHRGRCLIFNYEKFDPKHLVNGGKRPGSDVDVKRLKVTFTSLGYDVKVHLNLTISGTKLVLDSEAKLDHGSYDSFIVCILTHGGEGDVLHCYDGAIASDSLIEAFTPDSCPTLAGKPKLFFIQACRGKVFDGGYELQTDSGGGPSDPSPPLPARTIRIPTHADIFIYRSAWSGYYSWRNTVGGSWFIEELCKVLDGAQENAELLFLMTLVAREVALNRESNSKKAEENQKKEMPVLTSTLTKVVRFGRVRG